MSTNRSIGVFIAGRLESERLPNKLILPIGESCLWDIACKKLNQLPDKYNKYALAEDGKLIKIAEKYSNLKVILRDKKTAVVDSPLTFIFKEMESVSDEYLMFLNPCLSFISINTINDTLISFENSYAEYGTSVKKFHNWLFNNMGHALNDIDYKKLSTKEIISTWQAAHCFHIFNKKNFFNDGMMLKTGHMLLPIPNEEAFDVDTYEEYEFARWKHERAL